MLEATQSTDDNHHHHHFTGGGSTRVSRFQKKIFWTFMVQGRITEADTDHPAGCQSIRTNQRPTSNIPPFLRRMPFLPQPSHFILARDRHQICWLAYQWHGLLKALMTTSENHSLDLILLWFSDYSWKECGIFYAGCLTPVSITEEKLRGTVILFIPVEILSAAAQLKFIRNGAIRWVIYHFPLVVCSPL